MTEPLPVVFCPPSPAGGRRVRVDGQMPGPAHSVAGVVEAPRRGRMPRVAGGEDSLGLRSSPVPQRMSGRGAQYRLAAAHGRLPWRRCQAAMDCL